MEKIKKGGYAVLGLIAIPLIAVGIATLIPVVIIGLAVSVYLDWIER